MEITKEEAREKLSQIIKSCCVYDVKEGTFSVYLPITDLVLPEIVTNENNKAILNEYTFRYLLQVAYDLEEKKLSDS